ncbi:MAG: DUF3971 domain-containing protein [Proteobacteria bacterium]|nr:DUF3971 domain-containing protein [Pseudomonadota bacterium]
MVKKTYRVVLRAVGVAVIAATALVVVAALRLLEGPVDLEFLKARVAAAADVPGNDIRPEADRIFLEWGGLEQPMKLVFTGVRFVNKQHETIATAPSIAMTFEARSVFQGMLLPTSITISGPTIEANIAREGGMLRRVFADTGAQSQSEAVLLLVEQLFSEPNDKSLLGRLDRIQIEHAKVTLRDVKTGLSWTAPDARARLSRDKEGVSIAASARLTGAGGNWVDVNLSGVYARDRSRIALVAGVDGFKPSMLADLSPDVELLRGVDLALAGRLYIDADGEGNVRGIEVEVTGGNGDIRLPGILPATHRVRSINARGVIDARTHTATIERADMDFGAAKVTITGAGEKKPEGQVFVGRVEVKEVPVDRLGDYWPLPFAPGGREWSLANLSKGQLDIAADFALSAPGNDIAETKVDKLVGLLGYRDLKVRYMPHMPELQGVTGTARYEAGTLHFDVVSGSSVGLRLSGTSIDLTGLDRPAQQAAIRMTIAGTAPEVIRFLARPQLGLSKDVLYDYRRLGGDVTVDVSLAFPLVATLGMSDLELSADATLTSFSLKNAVGEVSLSDATARVRYAGPELSVSGTGKLDGAPVEIAWREMFGAKAPFRRRYELKGDIPAPLVAKAGFTPVEPFVSGPIGTTLSYQVALNGTGEVIGKFDLKAATLDVAPVAWRKPAGTDGQAQATIKLAAGGKLSSIDFEGKSDGLAGKGSVRFTGDNVLQQVALQQFRLGKSDVALDWKRLPGGVELSIKGAAIELPRVREAIRNRDAAAAKAPAGPAAAAQTSTRMQLQVQNVLTERGTLGYVNGRLDLAGDRIAFADMTVGGGKGSTFRVSPGKPGRKLFLYVADFGQMLSEAGWIDGLVNGYLHIEGQYDDTAAGAPLDGFLKMGPFRLQKVTAARPHIGTLNAAIDGLGRAGNSLQQFDNLEAKVSKLGDRVSIRNGRTSGQSIGLTAQGYVDLANDTAKLSGVVVPAFQLNNLLSNVPLLGPLLTGGKDGGLFAVSYSLSGPLDDLRTDVNIMSAVTPGALRELFTAPADVAQPPPSPEMQRAP